MLLCRAARMKNYRTAISLFAQAESKGFTPSLVTLSILTNCYCHVGQMAFAFSTLGKILKMGCPPDTIALTTLMKGLSINNQFFQHLLLKGHPLNVQAYTAMINGLCNEGLFDEAKALLYKMEENGCLPNFVTFETIIGALLEKSENDKAEKLLHEMIDRGLLK